MIEAEVILRSPEAFLDGPSQTGGADRFGEHRSGVAEDEIVSLFIGIFAGAADQQQALPVLLAGPRHGDARSVIEPEALAAFAGGTDYPGIVGQCRGFSLDQLGECSKKRFRWAAISHGARSSPCSPDIRRPTGTGWWSADDSCRPIRAVRPNGFPVRPKRTGRRPTMCRMAPQLE